MPVLSCNSRFDEVLERLDENDRAGALVALEPCLAVEGPPEHWHVCGHLLQLCGQEARAEAVLRRAVRGYELRLLEVFEDGQRAGDAGYLEFWRGAALARLGEGVAAREALAL